MRLSLKDGWMLLYHYGIVLSGAYVVWFYEIQDRTRILAITLGLAIIWTAYFRFRVAPTLEWADEREDER